MISDDAAVLYGFCNEIPMVDAGISFIPSEFWRPKAFHGFNVENIQRKATLNTFRGF